MSLIRTCLLLSLAAMLPGCATLVEGSNQNLTVSTSPAGAQCAVDWASTRLGMINPTPGSLRIDKSKNDLTVTCEKEGFRTAIVSQTASFGGTTFGNILLGGGVGFIVDAASGANYTYPSKVRLDMAPVVKSSIAAMASDQPGSQSLVDTGKQASGRAGCPDHSPERSRSRTATGRSSTALICIVRAPTSPRLIEPAGPTR